MAKRIGDQDRSYFQNNFQVDRSLSLLQLNLDGFGAELAFCRLVGSRFNDRAIKEENHFNLPDFILPNGITGDVKQTRYPNGRLLVRPGKEKKKVDIYILMVGQLPIFEFKGWIAYGDIIKKETMKDLGKGSGFCRDQKDLIKTLKIGDPYHAL
jgi:hypothetical protein